MFIKELDLGMIPPKLDNIMLDKSNDHVVVYIDK